MDGTQIDLEDIALQRKIKVHEPFAEFLLAKPSLHSFEISLLDCYRFAGHACAAITGAFLVTETAVQKLFPETLTCVRGDLAVDFGSALTDHPNGPRSNVISYITGAWGESGFAGIRGNFVRKNLLNYANPELGPRQIQFRRLSTNTSVILEYNPSVIRDELQDPHPFPENWRYEICAILENSARVIQITS